MQKQAGLLDKRLVSRRPFRGYVYLHSRL
jgi:hypothetical protein